MHHHNFSGCLLCVRQLWGGQSQDEVSSWNYDEINRKSGLGDDSEVISGSLPRPSSVPSRCDTTLTPRAWTFSKTLPASTAWWRSCDTSWTSSVMPSVGWTSSWASNHPSVLLLYTASVSITLRPHSWCALLLLSLLHLATDVRK